MFAGGTDLKDDIIRFMQPVQVIVATPGRLLDLCNKRVADLSKCTTFVMDEADKLLSPEFVPLIDRLLTYTAKDRQILCFSATFPKTVKLFKDRWVPDAYEINLMDELTLKGTVHYWHPFSLLLSVSLSLSPFAFVTIADFFGMGSRMVLMYLDRLLCL